MQCGLCIYKHDWCFFDNPILSGLNNSCYYIANFFVWYITKNMLKGNSIKNIWYWQAFNGKKWEKFNSEKVASLAYARIQGKASLIAHFQNSSLMNEDKRCRPILFNTEGPNAGDQVWQSLNSMIVYFHSCHVY